MMRAQQHHMHHHHHGNNGCCTSSSPGYQSTSNCCCSNHHHHHGVVSTSPANNHSTILHETACCNCSSCSPIIGSNCNNNSRLSMSNKLNLVTCTADSGFYPGRCPRHGGVFNTNRLFSPTVLSFVFILIWSSVLSSIVIIHTYKEQESADSMMKLFRLHQDVGQLTFAIGNEMLTSLSLFGQNNINKSNNDLPSLHNQIMNKNLTIDDDPNDFKKDDVNKTMMIDNENIKQFLKKQNETDFLLQQVTHSLSIKSFDNSSTIIQDNLNTLRSKCVANENWAEQDNQLKNEHYYPPMVDCVLTFESFFYSLDGILIEDNQWLSEKHSKKVLAEFSLRDLPYFLFVRGMVHRFTALGLGLILVQENFNYKTFPISDYFYYYYSSRKQIESSFLWNVRIHQKYLEMEASEYQADFVVQQFNKRVLQEQENYLHMNQIFSKLFNEESLNRITMLIKKKNAESVERVLINGTKTKYVTDQETNQINIQIDGEFLELFGLQKIERMIKFNDDNTGKQNYLNKNITKQYEEMMRNQVQFLIRVQDFLNVSIYSYLAQTTLNEQTHFIYYLIVVGILVALIIFCLIAFICTYLREHYNWNWRFITRGKSLFNRRIRRRFWHLTSPTSTFKTYFSSSTNSAGYSTTRNPLLCNASCLNHYHHCPHQHNCYSTSKNCISSSNVIFPCSSPNAFLVSSSSKRTFAGGIINRYSATPIGNNGSSSGTKTALLTYKFENSRSHNPGKHNTTEITDSGRGFNYLSELNDLESDKCPQCTNTNQPNSPPLRSKECKPKSPKYRKQHITNTIINNDSKNIKNNIEKTNV